METQKLEKQLNKLVGSRLRYLRCVNGLTQEAVSRELAVAPQQIQKYEKGENRISSGNLYLLAELFKVPTDTFFPRQEMEEQLIHTRKTNRICRLLNAIPEEYHDDVEAVLQAFQKICSGGKQYI